jgi:DNA-directed RNA polymerase subunit alpha
MLIEPDKASCGALNPALLIPVRSLELSLLVKNCLNNDGIVYVGDLVLLTPTDLRRIPTFRLRNIKEIETVVASLGLRLGMTIPDWPPESIEKSADLFGAAFQ